MNEETYGASVATPRSRFGGVRTVNPWPCSSDETAFQLEPSAQAPWTSTIVGFGMWRPFAGSGRLGQAYDAGSTSTTAL